MRVPGRGMQPPPGPMPQVDVSSIRRKWLDLPYASTSPAQKLDIFLPDEGDGPFPVLLYIHGGAFASGDKRDLPLEPFLRGLSRGYAVVAVNYRLSGEAIFPAGLQDLKASIRWLRAHSADYHLDPERIAACGGSAGGYFSVMLCLTPDVPELDDPGLGHPEFPCDVQAGVDWFGPTDFLKMDEQLAESGLGPCDHHEADSPESRFLGGRITEIPEKVRQASPITYVHPHMPPILIQHGRMDAMVPVQQSILLAQAIERVAPGRCRLDLLDDAGHGDPAFGSDRNMTKVFAFLDAHLRQPKAG